MCRERGDLGAGGSAKPGVQMGRDMSIPIKVRVENEGSMERG